MYKVIDPRFAKEAHPYGEEQLIAITSEADFLFSIDTWMKYYLSLSEKKLLEEIQPEIYQDSYNLLSVIATLIGRIIIPDTKDEMAELLVHCSSFLEIEIMDFFPRRVSSFDLFHKSIEEMIFSHCLLWDRKNGFCLSNHEINKVLFPDHWVKTRRSARQWKDIYYTTERKDRAQIRKEAKAMGAFGLESWDISEELLYSVTYGTKREQLYALWEARSKNYLLTWK